MVLDINTQNSAAIWWLMLAQTGGTIFSIEAALMSSWVFTKYRMKNFDLALCNKGIYHRLVMKAVCFEGV